VAYLLVGCPVRRFGDESGRIVIPAFLKRACRAFCEVVSEEAEGRHLTPAPVLGGMLVPTIGIKNEAKVTVMK
jgi:hypothetical protein